MEYDSQNNRIISVQHTLSGYFYEWVISGWDLLISPISHDSLLTLVLSEVFSSLAPLRYKGSASVS